MKLRKSGRSLIAAATLAVLPASGMAAITGFSGFAAANKGGPATTTSGYSSDSNSFTLTDNQGGEVTTGFNAAPQDITAFQATFTYTVPGGNGSRTQFAQADGFSFILQNDPRGTAAIGKNGGSKGYLGTDSVGGTLVTNSVALGYEMYNGQTIQYYNNGTTAGSGTVTNINALNDANKIQVAVNYTGTTLTEAFYDTGTHQSYFQTYKNVNIPAAVGGNTALVGFGGGTGGAASNQNVSNFTFTPTSAFVYSPIALNSTSFNQDMVVESTAPASGAANNITATMDGGLAKTGATYYEIGYNTAALTTGLPASGSTFLSQAGDGKHTFTMQSYTSSNALLLNAANGATGTMTFATPTAYASISVLAAVGNGISPFSVVVNYADGAPSTVIPYDTIAPDWFFQGPPAYDANGRAYPGTGATTYDNVNNGQPNLYQIDIPMPDSVDPISSITFTNDGPTAASGNLAIFALSGAAPVPEPTSLALVAGGALLSLRRRRLAK